MISWQLFCKSGPKSGTVVLLRYCWEDEYIYKF